MSRAKQVERRARAQLRKYLLIELDEVVRSYRWADRAWAECDEEDPQFRVAKTFGAPSQRCRKLKTLLADLRNCEQGF